MRAAPGSVSSSVDLRDERVVQRVVGQQRAGVAVDAAALALEELLAAPGRRRQRAAGRRARGRLERLAGRPRAPPPARRSWPRAGVSPPLKCDSIVPDHELPRASGSCPAQPYGGVSATPHSDGTSRGPREVARRVCGWTIVPSSAFVPPPSMWQLWHDSPALAISAERNRRRPSAARRGAASAWPRSASAACSTRASSSGVDRPDACVRVARAAAESVAAEHAARRARRRRPATADAATAERDAPHQPAPGGGGQRGARVGRRRREPAAELRAGGVAAREHLGEVSRTRGVVGAPTVAATNPRPRAPRARRYARRPASSRCRASQA